VDGEADDEERAEGERADRVGGPDRQPLAEVVEADADGDQHRQVRAAGPCPLGAAAPLAEPRFDPGQQQVCRERADKDEARAAQRLRPLPGDLDPLLDRVDREEREQADRERQQRLDPAPVDAPHEGQPEHAEGDGNDAYVDAEQDHQPEEGGVGLGRLGGGVDRVLDDAAGSGQEEDLVGLALDPVVGHRHLGRAEPADLGRVRVEVDVGVVDRDLGDVDRVGPVVADRQGDLAGPQLGAVDDQLLDRHPVALTQPGAAEKGEGADRRRDQRQRDQAESPGRQLLGGSKPLGCTASLH
jgi:hypothetical protein